MTAPSETGPFSALSVDLGSSSVKVLRGDVDAAGGLRLGRPRHLAHQPVQRGGYLEWDVEQLLLDVVAQESRAAAGGQVAVSLDSWGDGLVFLDRQGHRVGPVRCYRDPGLTRGADLLRRRALPEVVAERTGCTIGVDSTLGQLLAVLDERPSWLADVDRVVPLVDHLGALLTGAAGGPGSKGPGCTGSRPADVGDVGLSPVSTSGFVDPRTGRLDRELLDLLEIPSSWFPEPRAELRTAGRIAPEQLPPDAHGTLVKVAGHDTATALLADPERAPGRCYVSLGSWAVVGVVVAAERRGSAPFRTLAPVMHEATAEGDLRVNRNVPALRLVQHLEREQRGRSASPAERAALLPAAQEWEHGPVVDVFDLDVRRPVVEQIQSWGRRTGRPAETPAEQFREIFRGIAWAIARTVDDLLSAGIASAGSSVWLCGGGTQVPALPAWVGELTGRTIDVGPVAASAVGGVLGAAAVLRPDGADAVVPDDRWRRDGLPGL